MRGSILNRQSKRLWVTVSLIGFALLGLLVMVDILVGWVQRRPTHPVIEISGSEIDFGRLRPLETVERVLTIANRGGRSLRMDEPTTTCGCQKPRLGRYTLGPGERTELTLHQQAKQESGPFHHLVTIKSNDPKAPNSVIHLMGTVSRGVVVRPEPLVFAPLAPGETRTRQIEVASDNGTPFRLTHLHAEGPLRAKAVLNQPGVVHLVAVTLRGGETYGPIREAFILNTDQPDGLPLIISVSGSVVGPIRIVPAALMLGTVRGHDEVIRKIRLSGSKGTVHLKEVHPPPGGWRLSYRIEARARDRQAQFVELTIRVPATPGLIETMIRVEAETDDGQREVVNLPVSGVIFGPALEDQRDDPS